MNFSIKDFFSKWDQIRRTLKKSLMENLIFCAVLTMLPHVKKARQSFSFPETYYSISKDGEDMKAGFHLQKFLVDFGNPSSKFQGNLSHL